MTRLGGAAFVLIGVLGFVPGVTAGSQLFGVFHVSILLNLVHVAIGVAGIVIARLRELAVVSLALWLLGVSGIGAWLSLDTADNWLHLVLAAALLGLALLVSREDLADDLEGDLGGRLPAEV